MLEIQKIQKMKDDETKLLCLKYLMYSSNTVCTSVKLAQYSTEHRSN